MKCRKQIQREEVLRSTRTPEPLDEKQLSALSGAGARRRADKKPVDEKPVEYHRLSELLVS